MTRALVTGASGFIGRRLCARLAAGGAEVVACARVAKAGPWGRMLAWDAGAGPPDPEALAGVEVLFHLAARAHIVTDDPQADADYARVNVEGTRALLAAAGEAGVGRLVFFSSVKAMGEGGFECLDESAEPRPETAYGRTKLAAERLVLDWARAPGRGAAVLRLPLVYGPGVKGNLAAMLRAVDRGRFPPLAECGNRRSLVHVDDVVQAAVLAATRPLGPEPVYLVTDGERYSTRRLYEAMCAALGRRVPGWSVPLALLRALGRAGDAAGRVLGRRVGFDSVALQKLVGSACYNPARIGRELGFEPAWNFERSMPAMIEAYRRASGG